MKTVYSWEFNIHLNSDWNKA